MFGTIARGAAGLIGSALGSASLEGIASAIAGSPTENEARAKVAPLFNREVAKLMAKGMSYADAESHANEAISGHLQEEMSKSNLPEWAGTILNVVGGIGGWSLGAKLAGKGLARMGAKAVAGEAGAGAAKAASLADATVEDPEKAIAAGAVAEGSGEAAEGAAKVTPMFPKKEYFGARGATREAQDAAHAPGVDLRPGRDWQAGKMEVGMPMESKSSYRPSTAGRDIDAEFTEIPGAPDEMESPMGALLKRLNAPRQGPRLPMPDMSMPTDVTEERLMADAMHARKFPGRNPGYQARQLRELPFDERSYNEDMMRENPQGF